MPTYAKPSKRWPWEYVCKGSVLPVYQGIGQPECSVCGYTYAVTKAGTPYRHGTPVEEIALQLTPEQK